MAGWMLLPALVGLALTLMGCGGGGSKDKVNNNPPDLVSQTLTGKIDAQLHLNQSLFKPEGQVSVSFDADAMNLRLDLSVTDNHTSGKASAIVDGAGNLTLHVDQAVGILKFKGCRTVGLPIPLQTLKDEVKRIMKQQKPEGMDGDLRKFSMKIPAALGLLSGEVSGELDDDNVLHKASASLSGKERGTAVTVSGTFSADKAQGGSPSPDSFRVPEQWSPCTPLGRAEGEALAPLAAELLREAPQETPRATVVV